MAGKEFRAIIMKLTFKEFLMEVDAVDLELARDLNDRNVAAAQDKSSRNDFSNQMKNSSPSKGNIIVDKNGQNYRVLGSDMKGIHVVQSGGKSTNVFPHGTKYKLVGKNEVGVTFFKEI